MGLGKTIQIIAFLSGMYDSELVKHTLLVMPTSLLGTWTKEFAKWTPGMRVKEFHGKSKMERIRNLERVQRKGGVIVTTYNMLLTNWELLASYNGHEFKWDYVILDEAHKIKSSSTKTAKSAHAIPAKHRILLTGTPLQNNLGELWALFDFVFQGGLLGTSKTFKSEYENPITRAREKDATPGEKALGLKIAENLMAIINPYFLRRTKQEVQSKKQSAMNTRNSPLNAEDKENQNPNAGGFQMPSLTRKNDLIVWTYLSAVQEDIYRQFISLDHIKELLLTSRSPLAELNILKKLCDHPRLLSVRAVAQLGLEAGLNPSEHQDENMSAACQITDIPDETLVSESGKLSFLVGLLERLREERHRTLVFSQSRKMLDIIERVLVNRGFKLVRIDGTVIHLSERERRIALFQTDNQYSVFLLTTQVGGVGITLTAANRVVIFDPSWNPATDAQAVDRAYRIGQTENVVIYRLITCGTVEEKIYRRQIFKDSLIRQTTGDKKNPFRYFSRQELKELFTLEDTRSSSTQLQLQSLHSKQRRTDPQMDEHITYLHTMEMFGISDHDLMFSHDAAVHEDCPEDQESHNYIENRVQKAHELMKAESELQMQFMDNITSSTEPAFLRNPGPAKRFTDHNPAKVKPDNLPVRVNNDSASSPSVVDLTQEDIHNISNKLSDFVLNGSTENGIHLKENSPECSVEKDSEPLEINSGNSHSLDQSLIEVASCEVNDIVDTSALKAEERMTSSFEETEKISSMNEGIGVEELVLNPPEDVSRKSLSLQDSKASPVFQSLPVQEGRTTDEGDSVQYLTHSKLSILQKSDLDDESHADASLKAGSDLESFQGNFNLQLEESGDEVVSENENLPRVEDGPDLQLQMDSSRLHTEREQHALKSDGENFNISMSSVEDASVCVSEKDATADSFVHSVRKKKNLRVIYDSDDEENTNGEGDADLPLSSSLSEPFKGVGCSTPKLAKSTSFLSSTQHRKSIGGNTSVASRKSFIEAVVDDVEDLLEDMEADDEGETSNSVVECTGSCSKSDMEEDLEEETSKKENDETEDGEQSALDYSSESEMLDEECSVEESTGDLDLASDETMEQCAQEEPVSSHNDNRASTTFSQSAHVPEDEYESLVRTGKECYSEGKLKEALDSFLKALDIRSGDHEIQLMTIQLYRKLSQH
ncbi:DNA excision repair protein ERCC-6-like [Megalops cyprinoides]|uniref:DNA excision repair protein ERCC-6-like n=1 Tax=Megalops cyprinoides TaxID=118141 RepID=UPI0018651FE2|nr:DNA excision repair protein ERCC-6-like [Megalops cyprinoides]